MSDRTPTEQEIVHSNFRAVLEAMLAKELDKGVGPGKHEADHYVVSALGHALDSLDELLELRKGRDRDVWAESEVATAEIKSLRSRLEAVEAENAKLREAADNLVVHALDMGKHYQVRMEDVERLQRAALAPDSTQGATDG